MESVAEMSRTSIGIQEYRASPDVHSATGVSDHERLRRSVKPDTTEDNQSFLKKYHGHCSKGKE